LPASCCSGASANPLLQTFEDVILHAMEEISIGIAHHTKSDILKKQSDKKHNTQ
jgi:hypothetical protein